MKKLYLIEPQYDTADCDVFTGFLVCAENETEAKDLSFISTEAVIGAQEINQQNWISKDFKHFT